MNRRIKRFQDSFLENNTINLFRYNGLSKEGCILIYDILKKRYPNTNINIIYVQMHLKNHLKINYNLSFVLQYYINIDESNEEQKNQWKIIKENLNEKFNIF